MIADVLHAFRFRPTRSSQKPSSARVANLFQLEDRLMMSASPAPVPPPPASSPGNLPLAHEYLWVLDAEDAGPRSISLFDFYSTTSPIHFELASVSDPWMFDLVSIDAQGNLYLEFAPNAFGEGEIVIRTIDPGGAAVEETLLVSLMGANDRPTTTGLTSIDVSQGQSSTVIDLFASFDDVEDGAALLTYSVTQNSNPELFSSIIIDHELGTLTLNYAEGVSGAANITIRATDRQGAFVETPMESDGAQIYSHMYGAAPDYQALGFERLNFVTSWWIFPFENGEYDYTTIDEAKLRRYLRDEVDPTVPIVFDIEVPDLFNNTPDGRFRFAEVLEIANQERPNMQIGFYGMMGGQWRWWDAAYLAEASRYSDWNVTNWYTNAEPIHQAKVDALSALHDEFLHTPIGGRFGNTTLGEMLTLSSPSAYMHYRFGDAPNLSIRPDTLVEFNDGQIRLQHEMGLVNGLRVRFKATDTNSLPSGIESNTDYYIVGLQNDGFKISRTRGGEAINVGDGANNFALMGLMDEDAQRSVLNDPLVRYWVETNTLKVQEARRSGDPVVIWISPSLRGMGQDYLEAEFFRLQIHTLLPLVDGIAIWNPNVAGANNPANQAWWTVMSDTSNAIRNATQFTISISSPTPTAPLSYFDTNLRELKSVENFSVYSTAKEARRRQWDDDAQESTNLYFKPVELVLDPGGSVAASGD